MKLPPSDHPVTSVWLEENGRRLDSRPYVSGAIEARVLLKKLATGTVPLHSVAQKIFNGPRFARNYVNDPDYGVPFLGSTDIIVADLSTLPHIAKKQIEDHPELLIEGEWILISCSGTIGRMAYSRPEMQGMAGSQHFMRVIPNPQKILPGYLYAYLSSRFGVPQVVEGTYGAIIQHIEPHHIADLPIPRLGTAIEQAAHERIDQAAKLRSAYQQQIRGATDLLFGSVGLRDITAAEWHAEGPDVGFARTLSTATSLRALNFNPRLERLLTRLRSVQYMTLGKICRGGKLHRGLRFKRIDCEPKLGVKLIGQKELFWLEPEGRWISPKYAPSDIFVDDETIMVAAQGTLGENEVFCRAELITGPWLQSSYTEHLLRIQSHFDGISGAFLFAFLRSETVFRCFRSMSIGSKQQDLHHELLANFPVPLPSEEVRGEIEKLVRDAYTKRHKASTLEREAVRLVEEAIQEGASVGQYHSGGTTSE